MAIYFTSDLHFWHSNVIRYCDRPYSSVEEMNEALVNNWNNTVTKDDTVFILGDFSLAARPVETIAPQLNGSKVLISGNHDWTWAKHPKSRKLENKEKWIKFYNDHGLTVWPELVDIKFQPSTYLVDCKMAHLPYEDYNENDKYKHLRPFDDGRILLCGHSHEKFKIKRSSLGTIMINVGVDVWQFKPVSLDEIEGAIAEFSSV